MISSRKWSLPINIVIFNICKLIPNRNPKIWLFGGVEGKKFDDNSRWLFEYVSLNYGNNIHSIWIAKSKDIVNAVRLLGYEAYTPYSIKGVYYAIRAGVAIYSHALIDFGLFPLVGGSYIVSLWHGMGFKEIYNTKYEGWSLKTKLFIDKLFSWTYRDMTTVTSEYSKIQFQGFFNLDLDSIFITGQPRNDIFKRKLKKDDVMPKVDASKKWILFMPTYRGKGMGEKAISNIICELYNNIQFNQALYYNNCVFITKLHPLTPHVDIINRDNFLILDYKAVSNNQELIAVSDILITDYSSCFVDFALMNKPIHFYCPDEETFLAKSEKLNDDFFRVSKLSKSRTIDELISFLNNPSNVVCDVTNNIFEDEIIRGTCYSENVFKVICKEIGL